MNWTEASTRAVVKERSQGRCEKCSDPGVQMHHRKNRSQGGGWHPANIIHVCVKCHGWIGLNVNEAKDLGLSVHPSDDPAAVPIRTGAVPFLLDDEGNFVACDSNDVLLPLPGVMR